MPEISEVRIMSEFINSVASKKEYFTAIRKSPEHKSKTDLSIEFKKFNIKAASRGKELCLNFTDFDDRSKSRKMTFTMGMSGNWNYSESINEVPKHTHLMIEANDEGILGMHDVRRFARWDWRTWNPERGPDPVREPDEFKDHILDGIIKDKKAFHHPIYEVLMNQEYFNGIGNYLRAEILGRICLDPLFPADIYITLAGDDFFDTLRKVVKESYILGGGQFKDWYNQEDQKGERWMNFQEWIKFYTNKETCVPVKDRKDRVFWMDKKWIRNDK